MLDKKTVRKVEMIRMTVKFSKTIDFVKAAHGQNWTRLLYMGVQIFHDRIYFVRNDKHP